MTGRRGPGCSRTISSYSTRRPGAALAVGVVAAALLGFAARSEAPPAGRPAAVPTTRGWVEVDYGELLDRRRPTHSGEPVGALLGRLAGRPLPPPGERPEDALAHSLLDPIVERYAFVLSDAIDAIASPAERAWVEVGALWEPGERQPAWAELLRARAIVAESDGAGRMRVFAPWGGAAGEGPPASDTAAAPARAYERAWPVLRLVFAAERRRLARAGGNRPEDHPLEVDVRAYVHEAARSRFRLGVEPYQTRVADTRPRGDRAPLDLEGVRRFLDGSLLLEGGRLEDDGTLRLLGSEAQQRPALLGRPISLADWAVAWRAVAHGGLAEPYMSLDRGAVPQTSVVNYGGRLRDTGLGLVSLLCDIRFKTFSLGADIVADRDERERIRGTIPGFRTHLERIAEDPTSKGISGQQTRLWFYPDDVELTLSAPGDVLVMRRARMTAASERVVREGEAAGASDPPWTLDTVAAINRDYGKLGEFFPELRDLDQAARLLSLFAWLRMALEDGLAVPELDALLAVELPALTTPRTFPQLLAFNALPPSGAGGAVEVIRQLPVGEALDRLQSLGGALPAARRLERALRALDRRLPDHAALAREIEGFDRAKLDDIALDLLAYRAERLRMHYLVLSTLPGPDRERLARREKGLRVFSVGIGGLDLNMTKRLAKGSHRRERLAWGAAISAPRRATDGEAGGAPQRGGAPLEEWRRDPAGLPETLLPDHGTGRRGGPVRIDTGQGTWEGSKVSWIRTIGGANGADPTSRRIVVDSSRKLRFVERLEEGRLLRFRLDREGALLRARRIAVGLPPAEARRAASVPLPEGLATLEASSSNPAEGERAEVAFVVRGDAKAERSLAVPRPVLERLILGRRADPTPGEPLPLLASPGEIAGDAATLMVLAGPGVASPPWERDDAAWSAEEHPLRIAAALGSWWRAAAPRPAVVVGTDATRSPARWRDAPRVSGQALLLLPAEAFPETTSARRAELQGVWQQTRSEGGSLPAGVPPVVVLVSAEPPGVLGNRVRALASDPAMAGRLLAVISLAGPIRSDLPASWLAEGRLAGVGIAEGPLAGASRAVEGLAAFSKAVAAAPVSGVRAEEIGGPFLWTY